ncbi:MAG: hypothetical protein LBL39_01770 [Planctomycetaceae bacterium]|nr:hypothetical protein [Planctomycetaceae bacterium]
MKRLLVGEAYCLTGYGIFSCPSLIIPCRTTSLYEQLQYTTLIYQISLSSQQIHQPRPYALIFSFNLAKK